MRKWFFVGVAALLVVVPPARAGQGCLLWVEGVRFHQLPSRNLGSTEQLGLHPILRSPHGTDGQRRAPRTCGYDGVLSGGRLLPP